MAVIRNGIASGVSSLAMPPHAPGDLLLAFAFRSNNTSSPDIPAGWTSIRVQNTTGAVGRLAFKRATSSSEVSGTWTNASALIIASLRNVEDINNMENGTMAGGTASTVTYPACSNVDTSGSSMALYFAGHRSTNTNIKNPPTGGTNWIDYVATFPACEVVAHYKDGITSMGLQGVLVSGTASGWVAASCEIKASTAASGIPYFIITSTTLDKEKTGGFI